MTKRDTSGSCVLLSPVTINALYNEIYLQYVYHNLLVHILLSSIVLCISLGTLQLVYICYELDHMLFKWSNIKACDCNNGI